MYSQSDLNVTYAPTRSGFNASDWVLVSVFILGLFTIVAAAYWALTPKSSKPMRLNAYASYRAEVIEPVSLDYLEDDGHFSSEAPIRSAPSAGLQPAVYHPGLKLPVSSKVSHTFTKDVDVKHVPTATLTHRIQRLFSVKPHLAEAIVHHASTAAHHTGLPLTLVLAVIAKESSFMPELISNNDVGLMQVNTFWHANRVKEIGGIAKLKEPSTNILVGSGILADCVASAKSIHGGLRKYNGVGKDNKYPEEVIAWMKALQKEA